MSHRKLIPAVAATGAALALLTVPAMANAQTAGHVTKPAAKAAPAAVAPQDVHRRSFKCGSKKLNVSWGDGSSSTTVYFNNHCGTKKAIQTWRVDGSGWKGKGACLTVNPRTKGKKRIWDPGFTIYNITSPGKC